MLAELKAQEMARRAALQARPRPPSARPAQGGGAGQAQSPGGAKPRKSHKAKWPLREWVLRGTMAKAGRAAQLYLALVALANPKTRQYSGGRARLAEACGCSDHHVSEMLAQLEDLAMVKRLQTKKTVAGAIVSGLFVWILDPPQIPAGDQGASLPGMN
jgi:hypothetical protein